MSDERPESLAAQAAAWVPPWERVSRTPDAAYAADERAKNDDDLGDDDDDLDPLFEGPDQAAPGPASSEEFPGEPVPDEQPASGENDAPEELPATVDAPRELPGAEEPDPTDIGLGPELPVPGAIEEATEQEEVPSPVVDAPLPPDGDDAGDVFDHAADDDVTDDAEVDLPFTEEVPGPETDDEPALPDAATRVIPHAHTDIRDTSDNPSDESGPDKARDEVDAFRDEIDFAEIVAQTDAGDLAAARGSATTQGSSGKVPTGPAANDSAAARAAEEAAADAQPLFGLSRAGSGSDDDEAADADAAEPAERPVEPKSRRRKAEPADPPAGGVPAQGRRRKGGAVAVAEPEARTEEEIDLKPLDDQEMRAALEAILLVVDEPVAEMQLAQIMEQPTERVATILEDISARYTAAGHGFDLRRVAGGWRLYTRPEYAPYVERFVLDGQSVRLTQAALETLAVVAYKQPVTRSRISAIRGVNCDGVMRTLVTRGLIEECGTEAETGAFLYRTTGLFLEKLGLNSVDQLPPLAPFLPDDVEEVLDASG